MTNKTNIVIDIETVTNPVTAAEIELAMAEYEPPKSYKKAETIEKHRMAFMGSAGQRLADAKRFTLGGKRMISISAGIADEYRGEVVNIESFASDDLSIVVKGFTEYVSEFREYCLIGWNQDRFDVPEMIRSFRLTGIKPKTPPVKWGSVDLCNNNKSPYKGMKLKEAAKAMGIKAMGLTGDSVAKLHEQGDWETIKKYNEDDVRITGELYLAAIIFITF